MIESLAKSVLIPLGLTSVVSASDAGIHEKILGSGNTTTLIISNDEMENIIKIVKSFEDSGLLRSYWNSSKRNKRTKRKIS